ncbi:hypothetical protein [Methylocaldum szegediense]|uniref:hypothetical protein n=1 Tax=Methylocaldum szegediense TaxID=73780 RepID=UPI00138AE452|nr:hypothetical protein [Methylocaldum szegediense]
MGTITKGRDGSTAFRAEVRIARDGVQLFKKIRMFGQWAAEALDRVDSRGSLDDAQNHRRTRAQYASYSSPNVCLMLRSSKGMITKF